MNVPRKFVKLLKVKIKCEAKNIIFFNSNEKNKSLDSVQKILKIMFLKNLSREDCLISVGGGILGDMVGFAASIYKRGLKYVNIPTTLLSQVDASIGGKTGVNNIFGKNLVGSFYQPDLVISDVNFLKTLPNREFICGYAEILKHSFIYNRNNFKFLKKNISNILARNNATLIKTISNSCKIKKTVVEKDENESHLRKVLNFGHTFAHAFESTLNYSGKLNHGEAVILGMEYASKFSLNKKIMSQKTYNEIYAHLKLLNLNDYKNLFSKKHINRIVNFMVADKKNKTSKINLILLKDIGKPILNNTYSTSAVKQFLQKELQ